LGFLFFFFFSFFGLEEALLCGVPCTLSFFTLVLRDFSLFPYVSPSKKCPPQTTAGIPFSSQRPVRSHPTLSFFRHSTPGKSFPHPRLRADCFDVALKAVSKIVLPFPLVGQTAFPGKRCRQPTLFPVCCIGPHPPPLPLPPNLTTRLHFSAYSFPAGDPMIRSVKSQG